MLPELDEVFFPDSLEEALAKKREYGDAAAPIAGGTDIVPDPPPGIRCLIDITRLGLNTIVEGDDDIRIGATATMQQVATSAQAASLAGGMLSRSTCEGWPTPVRNTATLGGNLAGAGPFADTPPALLALDASAVIVDEHGEKMIPLEEFFLDYRTTAVGEGILTEVRIPKTPPTTRGIFLKLGRTSVDQAMVNVGILVDLENGLCRRVRIALGAVTRTPTRMRDAEEALLGHPLDKNRIERAEDLIMETVDPILDFRASADYRRKMSGVLVRRALTLLAQAS